MTSPVVAFTANDRPQHMRDVLQSWSRVRGVENAVLLFRVEPGQDEMAALCETASRFAGLVYVCRNDRKLGELSNPWHVIEDAFEVSDFVVYAEDDDVVSDDILEYFAWAQRHFRDRPEVLTVSAFRHHRSWLSPNQAELGTAFTSWVFGIWQDRWQDHLRDDWDHDYRHKGWDWRIIEYWLGQRGMKTVLPGASRSQHIGKVGVHFRAEAGDLERLQSTCFQASYPPDEFSEVAHAPGPVRPG